MCVNFVYKGLLYDFLLRISSLLNVGHTAVEKPCPNWEGFKTIFCFFGQWFHELHLATNCSLFEISDTVFAFPSEECNGNLLGHEKARSL